MVTYTPAEIAAYAAAHEEWIELMNNSVSEFAADHIRDDILAEAAAGDYYARQYVASEAQYYIRLEAKSNEELAAELVENEVEWRKVMEYEDEWELDVNDYEEHWNRQYLLRELLEHRAALARYTNQGPLTHNPFAGLAA